MYLWTAFVTLHLYCIYSVYSMLQNLEKTITLLNGASKRCVFSILNIQIFLTLEYVKNPTPLCDNPALCKKNLLLIANQKCSARH